MANKNLNAAKTAKKDDFYTEMIDIERELQYYWPFFLGKIVFCNCDDPYESNFFKYFGIEETDLYMLQRITRTREWTDDRLWWFLWWTQEDCF